ncbi:MAG TPA: RagB/SusD family nutrient uptake outer membrane protein [Niabella sp.]|nr:RagB/SusD family nutrient uptake outer membrane protein [Niabella sp.]
MKKLFVVIMGVLLAFTACKKSGYLDSSDVEILNNKSVFSDSAHTMEFLTGLYTTLSFNYTVSSSNNEADYSKMCDEAEGRYPALGNYDKTFAQGTFAGNFYSITARHWATLYTTIHNANVYLADVDRSPLSGDTKRRTKAEARFLRAFCYEYLLKFFGGVPLVGDRVYATADAPDTTRATYSDCVNYIVSELDAVAAELPESYSGLNWGRITKGACLALKSRVLLFAASPLYNGGSTATDPRVVEVTAYPSYDATRWEKARQAALDVMNLTTYSLNMDNTTRPGNGFYKVFITRVNNEIILPRPMPTGKSLETAMNPRSRGGGQFYYFPTQELVDKFPMRNGLPITDAASGYTESNPYVNRDPRLDYTVIYNGSMYYLQSARGPR